MAVIVYSDIKHKVLGGYSNGTFSYVDEDITALFNDGVVESTTYKVSPNDPYNKVVGKFTPQSPISRFEIRVNPIEDQNYGPNIGNLLFYYQGALVNRTYPFTFLISTESFTGSQSGIYRICLLAQKEVDHSWDYTQIFTVLNTTKTAYLNYKPVGHDAFEVRGGDRSLPYEYQRIEYLQSTGTQCIDTLYVPTANFKYRAVFELTAFLKSGQPLAFLISSYKSGNRYDIQSRENTFRIQTGAGEVVANAALNTKYDFTHTASTYTLNGITGSTQGSFVGSNDYSIQIFADRRYDTNTNAYMKLYELQIYDNNVLVRNFIPCYRKSDNVAGLYDLVGGTFYTNVGTGTFTKGPVMQIPLEYQQVEYVGFSGAQQINTGIKFNIESASCSVDYQGSDINNNGMLLASSSSPYFWLYYYHGSGKVDVYASNSGGTQYHITGPSVDTNRHTAEFRNKTLYVDNTSYGSISSTTGTTVSNLFIGSYGGSWFFKGKVYSCKIWDSDGILVRYFIPCYRKLDSLIGFYDLIEGVFYTNSGTGSFSRGNAV